MSAEDIKAIEAGLAAQVTTYDEGGLRWCVTRREARVDVCFRTLTPKGQVAHPDMELLPSCTAVLAEDGLRLIEQNPCIGEDATELFPSLARHLDAHPVPPLPEPTDVRYLRVGPYSLRARRFNRGVAESLRVDVRVTWADGAAAAWMHAFDAELIFHPFGGSPELRIIAESHVVGGHWGQTEHLARFAVYAALGSSEPCSDVAGRLAEILSWGPDESVFAPKGGA